MLFLIFINSRPVFFFRHMLTALLPHKGIIVEGFPYE
nr:MAG TPA: hypothetical protein [Caudoviricetes sp.]